MNAKCRRIEDLGMVVIDYLQLMQSSGSTTRYAGENRQQVVADISRALKIMAKELHVPVLCLSQLSRANESLSLIHISWRASRSWNTSTPSLWTAPWWAPRRTLRSSPRL